MDLVFVGTLVLFCFITLDAIIERQSVTLLIVASMHALDGLLVVVREVDDESLSVKLSHPFARWVVVREVDDERLSVKLSHPFARWVVVH